MSSWEEKGREEVERLRGNKSFFYKNRASSHVFIVSVKEFDKEVCGEIRTIDSESTRQCPGLLLLEPGGHTVFWHLATGQTWQRIGVLG